MWKFVLSQEVDGFFIVIGVYSYRDRQIGKFEEVVYRNCFVACIYFVVYIDRLLEVVMGEGS